MASATTSEADVTLGIVVRPHGLRGDVRVKVFNEKTTVLQEKAEVTLVNDRDSLTAKITKVRHSIPTWIMAFSNCHNREDAEALRGREVQVPRSRLPEPNDEEYYHHDLIGLSVYSPEGQKLGEGTAVHDYPSVSCLEVVSSGKKREVPLIEPFLVEVDAKKERVIVAGFEELPVQPD